MSAEERIRKALFRLSHYIATWEGDAPPPERDSKDIAVAAHAALDEMLEELQRMREKDARAVVELEELRASIARYAEMAADAQAHAQQLQAELAEEHAGIAAELARVEDENPDVIALIKRQPPLVEASLSDKEVRRARAQGRRHGLRLACDLVSMSAPGEVGVTVEMLRALADEGE